MFTNYIKVAWRNLWRNKTTSIINIAGLAIALACVVLIVLYVQDERSYDQFLKNADHIFQVNMTTLDNGVVSTTGGNTAPAVGPALVSMYPEIESYARIYRPGDVLVGHAAGATKQRYFTERKIWAVDSNFLELFSYAFLQGDAASCLRNPNSVVITASVARKYFDHQNAIGKVLLFDTDKKPFVVTAVLEDIPAASSFQFDMLAPVNAYPEVKKRSWNWLWLQVNTYVKLKTHVAVDAASMAKLASKFPEMVKAHAFQGHGQSFEAFVQKGGRLDYSLLSFTDTHLHARPMETPARLTTLSDIKYLYIFSVIAVFIILLACINFMNLSTAQATRRAKEVGVRKVLGSVKSQFIKQFFAEALLYSFISTGIALLLVVVLIGPFNEVAGKAIAYSSLFNVPMGIFIGGLCLLTGFLAGVYPAFYLTAFRPVDVLKGIQFFKRDGSALFIRNGLVVFQFTISIVLIICTMVVFEQLQYTRSKDLGLNDEQVLVIENTKRLGSNEEAFRQQLTQVPGVLNASISSSIPTRPNFGDTYVPEATATDPPLMKEIALSSFMVDDDFISTLQMKVIQGRAFSNAFHDSASVILNETAAKQIGWKQAVGKLMDYPGNSQRFTVIAVVKDFSVESLHYPVVPFALFHVSSKTYGLASSYISVRLRTGHLNDDVQRLENNWKSFAPNTPFDYSFLDNEFDALYRSEQRMGSVFGIFTFLSIFVACLGLFGLSVYTAERRMKEISVRKILGASVQNVFALLSKDFLQLVCLSAILAFPVAWLAMHQWLEDFAYRIALRWQVFVLAAIAALVIALLTISYQVIQAAIANPAQRLRTE